MTTTTKAIPAKTKTGSDKRVTKKDQLVKLLGGKSGADLKVLSAKLGWQHHTTRAALSGLRKAGYDVVNEKSATGGASRYRILPTPAKKHAASAGETPHGA